MMSMVFVGCVLFFSALIQGITSFGFSLLALPLLLLVMPLDEVVPLLVILSLCLNLLLVFKTYKNAHVETLKGLFIGGTLGIPLGIWALNYLSSQWLKAIAGLVIILVASVQLFGWRIELKSPKKAYGHVGFVSGILQGALSLSGPPVAIFLANQNANKDGFRATLSVYFLYLNLLSLPGFIWGGQLNLEVFTSAVQWIPILAMGLVVGIWVARKISEHFFSRFSKVLLILSGIMALTSAFI